MRLASTAGNAALAVDGDDVEGADVPGDPVGNAVIGEVGNAVIGDRDGDVVVGELVGIAVVGAASAIGIIVIDTIPTTHQCRNAIGVHADPFFFGLIHQRPECK